MCFRNCFSGVDVALIFFNSNLAPNRTAVGAQGVFRLDPAKIVAVRIFHSLLLNGQLGLIFTGWIGVLIIEFLDI